MEGVGVFHDELARAHEAKAWTEFVTVFAGDLIEGFGEVAV